MIADQTSRHALLKLEFAPAPCGRESVAGSLRQATQALRSAHITATSLSFLSWPRCVSIGDIVVRPNAGPAKDSGGRAAMAS